MTLRRMCLLILGFAISIGICGVWFVSQRNSVPVAMGFAEKTPLPVFVAGTDLLAEELVSYEGEYIEDTEFGEYVFVTGLLLRNTGEKGILCAKVKLIGECDTLDFEATYIPPGKSVLVLEKNRKETADTQFYSCVGQVEYSDDHWEEREEVEIQCLGNDLIQITNTAEKAVTGIELYYKTDYAHGLFYMGGITHCYRIRSLSAGKSVTVSPEYYASDCSQVVYIKTESQNN